MYLHIIDDVLTMNHFIRRVQSMDCGQHHFVVISPTGHISKVIMTPDMAPFIPTNENIQKLAKSCEDYTAVFIHNLCYVKSRIILEASENVVFVWGIWGTDYYTTFPELYSRLFLPYTRITNILLGKLSLSIQYIHHKIQPITRFWGLRSGELIQQRAAARINYTFNNMPQHSEVFNVINMKRSHRFHISYYSIGSLTKELGPRPSTLGPNILIGNSASNTSNHLDAFIALRGHIKDRKVIVPLGYGSSRYRSYINVTGNLLLKDQFSPINERLSLHEYHQQLFSCNVMIFNHKRAQGLGNIVFGVWAGHKIYLRESNPFYAYLSELGIKIFLIESPWTVELLDPLPVHWQKSNRKIIELQYSEIKVKSDLKAMLDHLKANPGPSQENKFVPKPSQTPRSIRTLLLHLPERSWVKK